MSQIESNQPERVIRNIEEFTRDLAHTTRDLARPSASYPILGELATTLDHLTQTCRQLSSWHRRAEDGTHYDGEDGNSIGSTNAAADEITTAMNALSLAASHIHRAHSHNSVVRWYDQPQES